MAFVHVLAAIVGIGGVAMPTAIGLRVAPRA
jgi:hypothetical protein